MYLRDCGVCSTYCELQWRCASRSVQVYDVGLVVRIPTAIHLAGLVSPEPGVLTVGDANSADTHIGCLEAVKNFA